MIKLVIEKIEGYNYELRGQDNKVYKLHIEFYDLPKKPDKNDYMFIDESLVREVIPLSFGPMNSQYGRDITSSEDKDLLILVSNDKKLYLKRFYG